MKIGFRVGDLTNMDLGRPYDVLFDRGVYHGTARETCPAS